MSDSKTTTIENQMRSECAEEVARLGILPCPFCGLRPITIASGEGGRGLMIECVTSGCVGPSTSWYSHSMAIRTWNRRPG
jgi:hypothetical protein